MCENGGGGNGRGGSEEADAAGLCGDDGFDGSASGALRFGSGDSRPALLRLEHSRSLAISSSCTTSGELVAVESSTCQEKNDLEPTFYSQKLFVWLMGKKIENDQKRINFTTKNHITPFRRFSHLLLFGVAVPLHNLLSFALPLLLFEAFRFTPLGPTILEPHL